MSDSLWPSGLQHDRPPFPSPIPEVYSHSCPLSQWCHPTISSSVIPFSFCLPFPAPGSFQMSQFFASGGQNIGVQLQHQSFQWTVGFPTFRVDFLWDWLVWSPCFSSNSQESSPTPQFESTNSLALSLLYGPTLTSYWKNKNKNIALTRGNFGVK